MRSALNNNTDARYTIRELGKAPAISISKEHFCKVYTTLVVRRPKEGTRNICLESVETFFQILTKISLLMLLQVMKPGFISMNHSKKLNIKFWQQKIPRDPKFYQDKVLEKLKRYYSKHEPKSEIKNISLLHDSAPSNKSVIQMEFLQPKKVTVLPHPP